MRAEPIELKPSSRLSLYISCSSSAWANVSARYKRYIAHHCVDIHFSIAPLSRHTPEQPELWRLGCRCIERLRRSCGYANKGARLCFASRRSFHSALLRSPHFVSLSRAYAWWTPITQPVPLFPINLLLFVGYPAFVVMISFPAPTPRRHTDLSANPTTFKNASRIA